MREGFLTLDVPQFGRLADYAGVWAIEPRAGAAMLERYRRADLVRHVAEADPPKRQTEAGIVTAGAKDQKIGVVMLAGPLMKSVGSMEAGTSTVQARRDLRKLAADPEVGAILLAIDSPGGSVSGTASLAEDILAAKKQKPVWAFIDDLGASAAYWLASQTDRVLANDRTALVGSIGTLAVVYDMSAAAEKEGIRTIVIGTGPLKGAGAPGAPITQEQIDYFRGMVDDAQLSFDAAVRKGRGLSEKQLADAKTGGVFGAAEALDRKLIDGIQNFDATLSELAAEARRRSRQANQRAAGPVSKRSEVMNETTQGQAAGTEAPALPDPVAAQNAAAAANLKRIAGIQKAAANHAEIAAKAIEENWSVEKTEAAVASAELAALKAGLANNVRPMGPGAIVRSHDRDCTADALGMAMILRSGGRLDESCYQGLGAVALKLPGALRAGINAEAKQRAMEYGHRFSNMSLVDICREAIRLDRREAPDDRGELIRAAFSGSSLTEIFTTSVNAMLLTSYTSTGDTTQGWTSSVDVADFKTQDRPRVKVGNGLTVHPRGSEADHATYADVNESYKIRRFSQQFVVDEQDIIDDSMSAFADTPRRMGEAAAWLRPDIVYYILLANANLDATALALFHADQDQGTGLGNLDTGSALAATTLKVGYSRMTLFQENSRNLNIRPTHLIVPPTLLWTARELSESTNIVYGADDETIRGDKNVLFGLLNVVADARLENGVTDPISGTAGTGSAANWFLASNTAHTIEVGYLRGTGRAPQVRSFVLTQGQWGMGWDVKLDIGAKALDWKGLYQAQG